MLNNVGLGLGAGAMALYSGIARTVSSCAKPLVQTFVPANPFLQFVGVAIIATTLIYAAYKYFT